MRLYLWKISFQFGTYRFHSAILALRTGTVNIWMHIQFINYLTYRVCEKIYLGVWNPPDLLWYLSCQLSQHHLSKKHKITTEMDEFELTSGFLKNPADDRKTNQTRRRLREGPLVASSYFSLDLVWLSNPFFHVFPISPHNDGVNLFVQ